MIYLIINNYYFLLYYLYQLYDTQINAIIID